MIDFPALEEIVTATKSKIIMLVVDGLGGLPNPETRLSELETANTPNLDRLANESACGVTTPVFPGITPGSGPGHLALFGYDPVRYLIGRGVLEALGIGIDLKDGEVAARGNFCTIDSNGLIIDRRAGRIDTNESSPLCNLLDQIEVPEIELSVYPVKDYRLVLVLRGQGLSEKITETDPQVLGASPLASFPLTDSAQITAQAVNNFLKQGREILQDQIKANMVVLRGFSEVPKLPSMRERYLLNPAAIAAYPMYRGLASLLGMKVIQTGPTFEDEIVTLQQNFTEHDFFYIHYKPADAAGEDNDFGAKVHALEALDVLIPKLLDLNPDVFMVAGDHSTPAILGAHSWHPVPFLINSQWTKGEGVDAFDEKNCSRGSLGNIPAVNIMLLALAQAGKLIKFGP